MGWHGGKSRVGEEYGADLKHSMYIGNKLYMLIHNGSKLRMISKQMNNTTHYVKMSRHLIFLFIFSPKEGKGRSRLSADAIHISAVVFKLSSEFSTPHAY